MGRARRVDLQGAQLSRAFPALTEAKRAKVAARIAAGESDVKIARAEKVNVKTVIKMRRVAAGEKPETHVLGGTAADRKIVRLEKEVNRLRSSLREAHSDSDMRETVRQVLGQLVEAEPNPPTWLTEKPRRSAGKHFEVPVLSFADWHCSETVSKAQTEGANEFNLEIADRRIQRLVNSAIDLCRNHHGKDYPGIVVNLVGDFISGALHEELAKSDEIEVLPTVLWVLDRLEAALRRLIEEFGYVFVPCVPGNHGRNTKRPEFKNYVFKNLDWLIYQLLAKRFEGDDRIVFSIPESGLAFYRIYGKRFMLIHGDQMGVKGGDGIIGAIGPIMRGEIKVRNQQMTLGRDYDYLVLGHWHQSLWLPRAIVSNCLKGFDEYAANSLRAVPSTPSQPLFFVQAKWGITSRWEVYCEDPAGKSEAAPWISVFGEKPPSAASRRAR